MTRTCPICKQEKPAVDFHVRSKFTGARFCDECVQKVTKLVAERNK